MEKTEFNLADIRNKLASSNGPQFWRSLDEVADSDEVRRFIEEEYPNGAPNDDPGARRNFLKFMGFSFVMAMLEGCGRQPLEKIVPYVKAPEEFTAGMPLAFATGMPWNGAVTGLLAKSHLGRPVKIEGNPEHPDSLGATNAIHQAAILGLYDPDRSKSILEAGNVRTWQSFSAAMNVELAKQAGKAGAGMRIMTETVTSPSLTQAIQELLEKYPKAQWIQWDSVNRDNSRKAQQRVFKRFVDPSYQFDQADIVWSLDSDFMTELPGSLRYIRQFAGRRDVSQPNTKRNRFYALDASVNLTGSNADERLAVTPSRLKLLAGWVASELGLVIGGFDFEPKPFEKTWLTSLVQDLKAHKGHSLIIAGESQPAEIHALCYSLNQLLGNVGHTVQYIEPIEASAGLRKEGLQKLSKEMRDGKVDFLLILGANPAYDAPSEFHFADAINKVRTSVHLSLYEDETSSQTRWHIPEAHFLEVFADGKASDGTQTLIQPAISPLYNGKSSLEVISLLLDKNGRYDYDVIRDYWKDHLDKADFEKSWRKALHDGLVENTALNPLSLNAQASFAAEEFSSPGNSFFEIAFRPDPSIWDGRFANNGWLQECPKPLTKLTWDNAALLSPADAETLSLQNGDKITLSFKDRTVETAIWIQPGQPAGAITLHLGYGRNFRAKVGSGLGFNFNLLRDKDHFDHASGVELAKLTGKYSFATTQLHHGMEGRDIIRTAALSEFQDHPDFAHSHEHPEGGSFYKPYDYSSQDYSWGMTVNLNACVGCNACVTACQSENNIPIVGKEEVAKGREMHWIRIDRYYEGSADNPETHHQPVMCMHCENAPCEPVCPVGATVHSSEGLNEMVYNRCVGTRYCSNNCPYKVRRFNFFQYSDTKTESLKLMHNPDVTVRNRGVMEKCTFCVQRINTARITSKKEERLIKDGEVVTACQSVCPARAMEFGNLNDKDSKVNELKNSPLNYGLLTELNTVPRLTYLAKVTNPANPKAEAHHD